ncbi:ATP-dependent DNA helicase PcrA [Anaerobacterium chartisolvens]|uniref:ATP-dependent DNA helicase PcrA n=1 Tax=Anaerobacterium chartisolvens TaxID=1297424 RepID=A0A369BBN4_9FIRM|nr:UvrD-helicase domain-containing protein [Anaerobacterium chartisolvens]RCX18821.1 ATP-dependent DNA helicase PcrA [Anaerobacterium chartisolvens]
MTSDIRKEEFYRLRKRILEIQFERLNDPQKEAVFHINGPQLILAGAGSGKTAVLTNRIVYMIKYGNAYHSEYVPEGLTEEDLQLMRDYVSDYTPGNAQVLTDRLSYMISERGVHPANILAITFTNKAAREMRERIDRLVEENSEDIWVSTFHSCCARILRRDIDKIGFDRSFVIYDYPDQQTVVKDCLRELNINDKNFPPKSVLEMIGKAKDELIEPSTYSSIYGGDFKMGKVAQIYELYQKKLRQNNALDFDDIIMYTIKVFLDNPHILEYYHRKFKYILVDEYQDTNTAQYSLISLLAQKSKNLCVVGDDDQCVYAWRGANIKNILDFEKEFKGCKVIKLEQNYRSTQTILNAANGVIQNNTGRKDKSLWTDNLEGNSINLYQGINEHDEASFISEQIKTLSDTDGRSYKDFAVLYRVNAQSRVIEDMLMREGIPYKIVGGLRFYDRKEIKDIIAYLRVIQNPADNISLKRIINVPKRGIGDTTVGKAEEIANRRGCSIFSVISSAGEIPELQRAAAKLHNFELLISRFRAMKEGMRISDIIEEIGTQSGILKELEQEDTPESRTRIENIRELISVALEFEKGEDTEGTLEGFLENISLVADIDSVDPEADNIVLMTLHSAKGLEFPVVFMAGMEEGVFPGYRAMVDETEVEEERRLCYVGITRAREKLFMTGAYSRTLFGNTTYNKASRFIKEIPENLIADLNRMEAASRSRGSTPASGGTLPSAGGASASPKPLSQLGSVYVKGTAPSPPIGRAVSFSGGSISIAPREPALSGVSFSEGDTVQHKKFGVGVITSVEKEKGDFKLEIQFEGHGMKRLMAAFANLKKL